MLMNIRGSVSASAFQNVGLKRINHICPFFIHNWEMTGHIWEVTTKMTWSCFGKEPFLWAPYSDVWEKSTIPYRKLCIWERIAPMRVFFFFDRKPRMNILIEKEVQKEDEESSRQK